MYYDAIFFDADGVLVKNKYLFTDHLQKEHGLQIKDMLPFFTGAYRECSLGEADVKEELAKVIDDWGWSGTVDELVEYWLTKGTEIDAEVLAYARELKASGVHLYMTTDQERYRGERLREVLGNDDPFEEVYFSADLGVRKENARFWEKVCEDVSARLRAVDFSVKLQKDRILVIDDDPKDLECAAGFGLRTFHFQDLEGLRTFLTH